MLLQLSPLVLVLVLPLLLVLVPPAFLMLLLWVQLSPLLVVLH